MNVEVDGDKATIWETVKFTMNMGDFNSMTIEFGHSRKCDNDTQEIHKCATIMHKYNQAALDKRMKEIKELYDGLQE